MSQLPLAAENKGLQLPRMRGNDLSLPPKCPRGMVITFIMVEIRRIELLTSFMPCKRSPS